jgi:HSP20 family protein
MAIRDLIPWSRGREIATARGEESNPFLALHREMNRVFDDVFRGFNLVPFGNDRFFDRSMGWPHIEVSETDQEIRVTAELPGLDEDEVQVDLTDGFLSIRGEKRTETEDTNRLFSERYYGHFERRIPVEDVDRDKVSATFKKGLLTVTMPKTPHARSRVKRIAINGQ